MSPDILARNPHLCPPLVVGIDPGADTGIARLRRGRVAELSTVTPLAAISYLLGLAQPKWGEAAIRPVVVIEDNRDHGASAKQRAAIIKSSDGSIGRAVANSFKRGMDAGGVAKLVNLYAAAAEAAGLRVVHVPSAKLPGKWSAAEMEQRTGWPDLHHNSNQHQRDAARIALYAIENHLTA